MCRYEVICKCGHVGRKNYIPIAFAVIADNGREAAEKARYIPRVKHDHKDAIISVREIDIDEFNELVEKNNKDDYLHCSNKQEQNKLNIEDRIHEETHEMCSKKEKEEPNNKIYFKKELVKHPKKFFKNIAKLYDYKEAIAW